MSMLLRLRPARDAKEDVKVVTDLDALIAEPVGFKLFGEIHKIEPVTTEQFLKFYQAMAKVDMITKKENINKDDLVDTYAEIFSSVCKTIGKKEILRMTQAQVGALFQFVIECVNGRTQIEKAKEDEKKK